MGLVVCLFDVIAQDSTVKGYMKSVSHMSHDPVCEFTAQLAVNVCYALKTGP